MSRTAPGFSENRAGLKMAQITAAPSIEPLVRTRSTATRAIASFHGSGSTSRLGLRRFHWKWFLKERNGSRKFSIGAPIERYARDFWLFVVFLLPQGMRVWRRRFATRI